jgi:8-oxo-dGTP diphosphatase
VPFTYPYPRPAVTADVVAFTVHAEDLAILLIRRKDEPFKGRWALPGGFVNENEPLERAAARELSEETGLTGVRLEQLVAVGDPGRDPRGHTVTIAYMTFLMTPPSINAGDDAAEAVWRPFRSLVLDDVPATRSMPPPALRKVKRRAASRDKEAVHLAFDHAKIIAKGYRRLCRHLDDPIRDAAAFELVPRRFTLAELKRLYEVVLGRSISPLALRRHLVDRGLVVPATAQPTAKKAAQLYRWNHR